jgi:hypothetical protein
VGPVGAQLRIRAGCVELAGPAR